MTGISPEHCYTSNMAIPPELARHILSLDFPADGYARYELLATKAQQGMLTPNEALELDHFLQADSLLAVLHLKAHRSLRDDAGQ